MILLTSYKTNISDRSSLSEVFLARKEKAWRMGKSLKILAALDKEEIVRALAFDGTVEWRLRSRILSKCQCDFGTFLAPHNDLLRQMPQPSTRDDFAR